MGSSWQPSNTKVADYDNATKPIGKDKHFQLVERNHIQRIEDIYSIIKCCQDAYCTRVLVPGKNYPETRIKNIYGKIPAIV